MSLSLSDPSKFGMKHCVMTHVDGFDVDRKMNFILHITLECEALVVDMSEAVTVLGGG